MSSRPAIFYVGLLIGAVMIGLGLFVALRPFVTSERPLTGQLWLDLTFAFFFLARGGMYIARLRRHPGV